jgi:HK97 family phage portal protein
MLNRALRRALGNVERRSAGTSISDPAVALILGGYGPTAAGVTVTPETAMRCVPVYVAIKVLAESLAQLPLHLYRRLPDGARERATDHPLEPLLSEAANGWMTASEFRLFQTTQYGLHGNAYAFVNRSSRRVTELVPLESRHVSVRTNPVTHEPFYLVAANGGTRTYDRTEILHIRGVGLRPYVGDSPIELAREAIALSLVLEQHGSGLFGRGARPAGLLKLAKKVAEPVMERLRASFERLYRGGDNAGRTAILEEGMEFQQLQLSSVDAQFLELRKFQVQEVSRIWRIPLHFLNDLERTTHNNAEAMGQQFVTFCLLPILKLWQDAVNMTLLNPEERAEYFAEFLVDDLVRANLTARFAAYAQGISSGILNPNEARAMDNRPPYKGGEVYMRPVNTAPAPTDRNAAQGQEGINDEAA